MSATTEVAKFGEESNDEMQTPETYLGYDRIVNYSSPESISYNQVAKYIFPSHLAENAWALQGAWKISAQHITSTQPNTDLKIHFTARKIFIVMGNSTVFPIHVKFLLNDEEVINEKGKDVVNRSISVNKFGLYEAVVLPKTASGILQVIPDAPGLEVYTFTFGG